jgi:hypothetical protein
MEKRDRIELDPYKYEGKEYRVFLGYLDLFEARVDGGTISGSSRTVLEQRITDHVESMKGNKPERLFSPIMQIDSRPRHGFGLSRYWATPADSGMSNGVYTCYWHTPPEMRCQQMIYSEDALPGGLTLLPFVDTNDVYYGIFDERLWTTVCSLNDNLVSALAVNKRNVLTRVWFSKIWGEEKISTSPDILFRQFLTPHHYEEVV